MGVTWTATAPKTPEFSEGWHPANFLGISPFEKGQWPSISWNFRVYLDGDPTPMNGLTSTSTSVKSNGHKMLTGILGRQPEVDENIDIESLIEKPVEVFVEDNGKGWPQVTKVRVPAKAK